MQVLTAGTRFDQEQAKDGKPIPTSVVTLLLTPEDAERIALAQASGSLMLVLRNPLDVVPTETRGVRMASLMGAPEAPPGRQEGRRSAQGRDARAGRAARAVHLPRRGHQGRQAHRRGHPLMKLSRGKRSTARAARSCRPARPQRQACTGWRRRPAQAPPVIQEGPVPRVILTAGRSTVLPTDFNITRIAITNPAVADAVVVAPREILIDGKTAGTISLIVWGDAQRAQYDLVVEQPVASLQQQLQALFPGEDIQVSISEDATILSGTCLEHQRHAARRGDRPGVGDRHAGGDQHAAGAGRQRKPAGAAAGAVCRGQSAGAEGARRVSRSRPGRGLWNTWGRATTQQFSAPGFDDLESTKVGDEVVSQSGE